MRLFGGPPLAETALAKRDTRRRAYRVVQPQTRIEQFDVRAEHSCKARLSAA